MKRDRIKRSPETFTDTDGIERVRVPLATEGKVAIVDVDDLTAWVKAGLSLNWCLDRGGYPRVTTPGHSPAHVGRLLVGAKQGERVRYMDGDPCNLRRGNVQTYRVGTVADRAAALDAFLQQQRKVQEEQA